MNIEIGVETEDEIVSESLKKTIDRLESDMHKGYSIFDWDEKEDVRQAKKMLKALNKVLGWYSV